MTLAGCSTLLGIDDLTLYQGSDADLRPEGGSGVGGDDASVGIAPDGRVNEPHDETSGEAATNDVAVPDGSASDRAMAVDTPELACDEYASVACDFSERCGPGVAFYFGTLEICKTRQRLMCLAEFSAPFSGATPELVDACARAEDARTCVGSFRQGPACLLKGRAPDGASCWSDWQCEGGRCAGNDVGCGTCRHPGQIGDSCVNSLDCADYFNTHCKGPFGSGKCTAAQTKGQTCMGGDCQAPLWCKSSVCTDEALSLNGDDCTTVPCSAEHRLVCDLGTSRCRPINFVAPRHPCDALDNCTGIGYCLVAQNGICPSQSPDGQICNADFRCILPARCSNGTCVLPDAARCSANDASTGGG
jgi:hypothetical protein